MEAEDPGAIVANHKALQLLLVHWEGAGFDVEVASSWEAEHVLTLRVPGYAVGIWFLGGRNGEDHVIITLDFGTIPTFSQVLFLEPESC